MSPRPFTPHERREDGSIKTIHVKRCCNGCGREIGDVTDEEIEIAVNGGTLPDVRTECGCVGGDTNG